MFSHCCTKNAENKQSVSMHAMCLQIINLNNSPLVNMTVLFFDVFIIDVTITCVYVNSITHMSACQGVALTCTHCWKTAGCNKATAVSQNPTKI